MNNKNQQIETPIRKFISPQRSGGGPKWLKIAVIIIGIIVLGLIAWAVYSIFSPIVPESQEETPQLEDESNNWKIYQSESLGIQVKIPKDFKTQLDMSGDKKCVSLNFPTESKLTYCIGPYETPDGEKSSIKIDNKDYDMFQEENIYEIPIDEDEEIIFEDNGDDYDLFEEIISGFEFIEEETFGWKVYQNTQFGFEITYPDILEMAEYYENYGTEEQPILIPGFESITAEFDGSVFERTQPEITGVVRIFVVNQSINDLLIIFREQIETEEEFVNKYDIKMNFFDAGLQYYLIDKNPKIIIFVVENTSEELEAAKILSNFNFLE